MLKQFIPVLLFLCSLRLVAQDYYLPDQITYDSEIPTPASFLGYEVGDWHVSHDQLVSYMRLLASTSSRVTLREYARSYENRPLLNLIITSPENHQNLDRIQAEHLAFVDDSDQRNSNLVKLVHYMGYSVHGNEASGSNAALLVAYYLAAAQGKEIEKTLQETVILLDPSFNPDGLQRFSTWVNMHKSANLDGDPYSREHNESWPGGRTNHYWFDLNRDWMPVQHPESKGRIEVFHEWKPNVLTDHHEMGSNSTFFFQPGVPSRKFPLTPQSNVTLTEKIAEYHIQALDSIGSLYFSGEGFDDYYIGKGSTYPDLNGAVGILFEQASARGHLQENQFGGITFPFAIRNHFITSLSTLKAVVSMKKDLLEHQRDFYKTALNLASKDPIKGYVFGSETDPVRVYHLLEILNQHQINAYPVTKSISINGKSFGEGSYIVSAQQSQYRLIKALFETRTNFTDSLFYDVSTWTLPYAFNLPFAELGVKDLNGNELSGPTFTPTFPTGTFQGSSDYAYAFETSAYYAHRAINRLMEKSIIVEVSHAVHGTKEKLFPRGSIIVPIGIQAQKKAEIEALLREIAAKDGIDIYPLATGKSISGSDLGSRNLEVLEQPKVAVLVGEGISGYETGEVWHLLDQRYAMAVTLLPVTSVNPKSLRPFNRLVLVNGSYSSLSSGIQPLKDWIASGGVVIAWKNGAKWLSDQQLSNATFYSATKDTLGYKSYASLDKNRGAQVIGGAIFETSIDTGHPLFYGLEEKQMPVFRNHSLVLKKSKNPYANPMVYADEPLLSGYISEEQLQRLKGTPAIAVSKLGSGRIISITDNPNFRAFWYGTNKVFMNALFFGSTISAASAE